MKPISRKGSEPKQKAKPTAAADDRVTVRNPNSPEYSSSVDAVKYNAMKRTLLKVLPRRAPGLTQAEMLDALLQHLPDDTFPGGAKAGWWMKCVQLDLEAQGIVVREDRKSVV